MQKESVEIKNDTEGLSKTLQMYLLQFQGLVLLCILAHCDDLLRHGNLCFSYYDKSKCLLGISHVTAAVNIRGWTSVRSGGKICILPTSVWFPTSWYKFTAWMLTCLRSWHHTDVDHLLTSWSQHLVFVNVPTVTLTKILTDVQRSTVQEWKSTCSWNIDRLSPGVGRQIHQNDQ